MKKLMVALSLLFGVLFSSPAQASTHIDGTVLDCNNGFDYVQINAKVRGHAKLAFANPDEEHAVFSPDGYTIFHWNDHGTRRGQVVQWRADAANLPYADVLWANGECIHPSPTTPAKVMAHIDQTDYVTDVQGTQKGGFEVTWNDGHVQIIPPIDQARQECVKEPKYWQVQYCMGLIDAGYPWVTTLKSTILHGLGDSVVLSTYMTHVHPASQLDDDFQHWAYPTCGNAGEHGVVSAGVYATIRGHIVTWIQDDDHPSDYAEKHWFINHGDGTYQRVLFHPAANGPYAVDGQNIYGQAVIDWPDAGPSADIKGGSVEVWCL